MVATPHDRLLPWWLERQLDPSGPDVVPGPAATQNTTHRDWVQLGTVGAPQRGVLDPRGLLTPWPDGWSLDWWVGADDRWHLPSRSAGVRQRLLDHAPVVETALRIPSGEMLHRAWAVAGGDGVPVGGAVVVELENASPVPVAVALAIRPWNPLGRARVGAIDLDGSAAVVDGSVAVVLPRSPSRVAVGDASTDALGVVISGAASGSWPERGARCNAGEATAAFLFPLPHTAVLRVVVPLVALPVTPPGRRRGDAASALASLDPRSLPDAERVAAGWEVQVRRAPRIELPERRLDDALSASRRHLLLHTAGDDAGSWPPKVVGGLDTAMLAVALDRQGLHAEAERLLVGFADRQNLDGSFASEPHRADAAAAWLWAVGEHLRLAGSVALGVALVGPVAKAAHHVQRRHASRRARRPDGRPSLMPPGSGPSWLPPEVVSYHDALWSWRGLVEAAFALDAASQPAAAAEVHGFAAGLSAALAANLELDRTGSGSPVLGLGPGDAAEAFTAVASLAALVPTVVGPGPVPDGLHDGLRSGVELLAAAPGLSSAVWHEPGHAGMSPRLSAALAMAVVVADGPGVLARLRWLLDVGEPLWTWPEFLHPRTGGGSGGQGHDGASTVAFLDLVRALLVVESPTGLSLLPSVPVEWYGQPVEVHDLPTAHGRLSFALRWHGERPALLWELVGHDDAALVAAISRLAGGAPTLTAPGLDGAWQTVEASGEALLAVPPLAPDAMPTGAASVADGPTRSDAPGGAGPAAPVDPPAAGASFT